jgi:hypothetical protein
LVINAELCAETLTENFVKELRSAEGNHIATMIMPIAELGAHVQPDMGTS